MDKKNINNINGNEFVFIEDSNKIDSYKQSQHFNSINLTNEYKQYYFIKIDNNCLSFKKNLITNTVFNLYSFVNK